MALQEKAIAFLADFGTPVSHGGETGLGILDAPGTTLQLEGVGIDATDYSLLYKAGDFPTLSQGEKVNVQSIEYQVRSISPLDDGVFSRAMLKRHG